MAKEEEFAGMEDYEGDVGLGAEDKHFARSNQLEWFKGDKGKTYRAGLVYFHPLDVALVRAARKKDPNIGSAQLKDLVSEHLGKRASELGKEVSALAPYEKLDTSNVRFKRIEAHFKEGFGYVVSRLGLDGPEADVVWKMLGDQKNYFSTVLVLYPTTPDGDLIKDQVGQSVVKPWRFSTKVYERLHQVANGLRQNDLHISAQDLSLKCTNQDYQNFDIDAAGKSLWRLKPEFAYKILAKAYPLYEKLIPFREMSTADLKIKLGLSSGAASETGEDDFEGLLENV